MRRLNIHFCAILSNFLSLLAKKAYWFWINFIHSRLVICLTIPASCAIFIRITFDFILIILHHTMSWMTITRTLSSDFQPRENNYSQSFRTLLRVFDSRFTIWYCIWIQYMYVTLHVICCISYTIIYSDIT